MTRPQPTTTRPPAGAQQAPLTYPCPRCDREPVLDPRVICAPCQRAENAAGEPQRGAAPRAADGQQPTGYADSPARREQEAQRAQPPAQQPAPAAKAPPPGATEMPPAGQQREVPPPAGGKRMSLASVRAQAAETPFKVGLYGVEGIGKTTFGMDAEAPIFVAPEMSSSLTMSSTPRFPQPLTFAEVLDAVAELAEGRHAYKTAVIDTIDKVQELATVAVVQEWNKRTRDEGKKAWDVEGVGGGYQKGYVAVYDKMRLFLSRLERLHARGMHVVLLAHGVVRKVKDPATTDDYDQWDMNLIEIGTVAPIASMVRSWLDTLLFTNFHTEIKRDKRGRVSRRADSPADGNRQMFTQRTARYRAKDRHGLPAQLPLAWGAFAFAILQAQDPEFLIGVINEKVAELGDEAIAKWVAAELEQKPQVQRLSTINLRLAARLELREAEAQEGAGDEGPAE